MAASDHDAPVEFRIFIRDTPLFRPLIDEFAIVAQDLSYLDELREEEYGIKQTGDNRIYIPDRLLAQAHRFLPYYHT